MSQIKAVYAVLAIFLIVCFSSLQADFCCLEEPVCGSESDVGFFIRGDLLYWQPRISGLELDFGSGSVVQSTVDDIEVTTSTEFDTDPHFNWNVGYRVGAGYRFACSNWEVGGLWTYFSGSGHRKIAEGTIVINDGKTRVQLEQIDVVVAYNASFSEVNLKPFVGVRAAKIHQSIHSVLVTDFTTIADESGTETRTFDDKQTFRGIGAVFGFQGDWRLCYGFGLYGSIAASTMYNKTKAYFDDSSVFSSPVLKSYFSEDTKHLESFEWATDLAIGISWQTCLCDCFDLMLKLGFEQHQYFDFNRLGANRGDLTFTGGVFSVIIGF